MSGLTKPKKYDVADTNIALFGSDIEKNARRGAAGKEKAWAECGKKVGTEVWRIEQFKVVSWTQPGNFYSGDSYIVLHTYKKQPTDEKLAYDLHFWLGKETTQDEAGTAAYKTVELDDFLNGLPVQHREIQGFETPLFLSYFPKFQVFEGGADSGFNHVKPETWRTRLLHIKGNRKGVVIREVPLSHASLNSGDVFILDAGLQAYQWNGSSSNSMEKIKAAEYCQSLESQRKGRVTAMVFDEGDAAEPFWKALGGKGPVKSAAEGGADEGQKAEKMLYRLKEQRGEFTFKEEAKGKVTMKMFDSNDVFVFDIGAEVYVWIGKESSAQEKKMGMHFAEDYLKKYGRPPQTPIAKTFEGSENGVFMAALDK